MAMPTVHLAALLMLGVTALPAEDGGCVAECSGSAPSSLCLAACLYDAGRFREAAAAARAAAEAGADEVTCALWEARSYLAAGNTPWAERALKRQPGRALTAAWLAFIYAQDGDVALARQTLEAAHGAPSSPAEANRLRLLGAWTALLEGDAAAATLQLAAVESRTGLFPEDREAWLALSRKAIPGWAAPIAFSSEIQAGYTSNSLAGSPTDPGRGAPPGGLARLSAEGRWTGRGSRARPVAEVALRGLGLEDPSARELSYLEARGRLGAQLGPATSAFLAGELLSLPEQADTRYSTAARGELERQLRGDAALLAAVGRRRFRDPARTRWEAELGAAGRVGAFTLGGTLRWHDTDNEAYDLRGVLLVVASRLPLWRGATIQATASAGHTSYYHSGGVGGLLAHGTTEKRSDLLGRLTLAVWSPPRRGVRVGVGAELARQDSTADRVPGFDFDFTERRVTLRLRWQGEGLGLTARTVRPGGHVPLPWGLGGEDGLDGRVLDLLRQDEELRRGSSCGV